MSEPTSPLPNMPLWHGAQLKKEKYRGNFLTLPLPSIWWWSCNCV